MTIFLCGFMGCGKTTVGHALAKTLGIPLIDTDEEIVKHENMSIPQIFEQKGEPYFRKIEAEIVCGLCSKNAVIACGGGAMLNNDTASTVKNSGASIVLLDLSFDECYVRIKDDQNRPIVQKNTKQQLNEIFDNRLGVYQNNATAAVKLSSELKPDESAKRIIEILGINVPTTF